MRNLAVTSMVAALLGAVACSRSPEGEPGIDPRRAALRAQARGATVLLITLDTTRADRLGCYGDPEARTPCLDRLAEEGLLFERVLASAPVTLPSHASLLTGRHPLDHGVHDNGVFRLNASARTLAELLGESGYSTAAFVSAAVLTARYGLDQGFEHYDDRLDATGGGHAERRAAATVNAVLDWLENPPPEPWFLWVHFFDPHRPFEPPEPFRSELDDPYAGEIASVDHQLARLLARYDRGGRLERTVLLVTSDHGEGLGDHRELTHGLFLYESTMRVPLLLRYPPLGRAKRVAGLLAQVDLLPTLLELVAVPVPSGLDGRSRLAELLEDEPVLESEIYLETQLPWYQFGLAPLEAACQGEWKYVEAPRPELYHLARGEGEKHNLVGSEPDQAERMRALLARLRAGRDPGPGPTELALGEDERLRLEALGYVGGQLVEGDRADPKDFIEILNFRVRAQELLEENRLEEAERLLRRVLALCPADSGSWSFLANALLRQGRIPEAVEALEECVSRRPDQLLALRDLAMARRSLGDLDGALEALELLLAQVPTHYEGRLQAAELCGAKGDFEKALVHLEQGLLGVRVGSLRAQEINRRIAAIHSSHPGSRAVDADGGE